ncbi:extracellular matrix protein FRAS1 isoform X2 [Stegostoma tigrinum]|uniref:extracellular matrix protein FRAS1 isoform X2 n=1 Tax=Stegostoma tigrinum TaxID=3053191 RepID=UPI0028709814|nr:extracellular matrix protein FRAS1 isoform X2 [Stegostoma tigrinum]
MTDLSFWVIAVVLIGFVTLPQQSEGACIHQGSLFANNTVWKPDSCQECSCHSDIVLCKFTQCRNPQCDFQKGEVFKISPNNCCPECTLQTQNFCEYKGRVHAHETEWMTSRCTICSCNDKKVECGPKYCPSVICGRGEIEYTPHRDCCPKCVKTGESCLFEGRMYRDGEDWKLTNCSKCVCSNGEVECYIAECQPLYCKKDEDVVTHAGNCCPECLPKSCSLAGKRYKHGDQWKKNECTSCICDRGEIRCRVQLCPTLTCEKGLNKIRRPGHCCEECVSGKGSCLYEGVTRYHGEMWSVTDCEFCMCERGQVICQTAECARVECSWGEELLHLPGKCCPECVSGGSYCVYKQQVKEAHHSDLKDEKHLQNGEKWKEGPCKECECRNSQVICYKPSCPLCPVGTLAAVINGECCPECQPVQCHADCLMCSRSPDHCDICSDKSKFLQHGRCLQSCEPGFYKEGGLCKTCDETCATCQNEFECISCKEPLLMEFGQCVSSCGDGHFQDQLQCSACHKSCSICHGPSERDCVQCRDRSHMLKAGACVANCGPGYFIKDGHCHACDSSCLTCYHDNPKCLTCSEGKVIHNGKCASHCPEGYYKDVANRCVACHASCTICTGSSEHCTSCPDHFSLHKSQCLATCPEGFYSANGVCQACSRPCRACVGPKQSDCTNCLKPEEVIQTHDDTHEDTHELPHGECVADCKSHFYVNSGQVCTECHATCKSCTGSSPQNCTACSPPRALYESKCLHTCPEGFYRQDDACFSCHPSCKQCDGPSDSDCLTCHPHIKLLNGYCRTSCREGQYLNQVGYCVDCQPQCQHCTADLKDTGSVCVYCKNPREMLFGDTCISHCPTGYFMSRGICQRCHSSCKTCSGEGGYSCTACAANLVLSHAGQCIAACPPAFYSDNQQICQACNSQCLTCESNSACLSCKDPTKVLLFGECQYESCAQQYYIDYSTGTCRECDWSCNACKGPLKTDCLLCMDGYVLQEGSCVEQCAAGFYKAGEECIRCHERCVKCSRPSECSQCEKPYLLLETQCVWDCGKRYYSNHSQQKCIACSTGCLECVNTSQCILCDGNNFLKNELCVPNCGPGYYGNVYKRTCEVNIYAPVIHANRSVTVGIGGSQTLDSTYMNIYDADTPIENLILHIVNPPDNGRLIKIEKEKQIHLQKGDTFTVQDLRTQNILFIHDKEKSRKGQFTLKASDHQLYSFPETVYVQALSLKGPYVLTNNILLLSRGELGTISNLILDVHDDDNPSEVVLTVLESPQHGRLILHPADVSVQQFQLKDLRSGQLRYVHDGTNSLHDQVLLQINDGHNILNILFQIEISQQKFNTGPQLLHNLGGWVTESGLLQITNRLLQATDKDASDSEIIFNLIQEKETPKFGDVILLVPMPADGPADGWQRLPDGKTATVTNSFTQQDLNDGIVWYQHSGVTSAEDSFRFQVTNGGRTYTGTESHIFEIGILPKNENAPRLASGIITPLQITALEDWVTVIQATQLSFVDGDTPSQDLVYNITVPLPPEYGTIEHSDSPLFPVTFFTQADIDHGKILYRPPASSSHVQGLFKFSFTGLPESVNFLFTVSDGEHTSPEMVFTIHLLSTNQQPPVFQISEPFLEVSQGGRATIGLSQLAVRDADTYPDDLLFELLEPPQFGVLMKSDNRQPLVKGDTFTHDDIARNAIHYIHGGTPTTQDRMQILVTDGVTTATTLLEVHISAIDGDGPMLAPESLLTISVPAKSFETITRSHLAYTDNNSPNSKIRIQLISLPMYGILTNHGEELLEFSTFTMEDIDNQRIRYTTDFDTEDQPITDIFHFTVYDADNNRLDNQMFTITITTAKNYSPHVNVRDEVTVEEGGRILLSSHNILATDPDTPEKDLLIKITSAPAFGYIENLKRDGRTDQAVIISRDVPFSVQDILNNNIYYVQSVHRNIEPISDSFDFYVTDGTIQSPVYNFNIKILRKNDEPPKMNVEVVHVNKGTGVVIRNTSLSLLDLDTPENELVFRVTKKPSYGKLRKRQFYSEPLENGRVLTQGSSFTYQDVLDDLIVYTHDGTNVQSDEFRFAFTDGLYTENGKMEFFVEKQKNEAPRLAINRGLQFSAGSVSVITQQYLKATDIDSDDEKLTFVITKDPTVGRLQMSKNDNLVQISIRGPIKRFTQADINKGYVEYRHEKGEPGGSFAFKFDVVDTHGNKLIDQSFFISVLEDKLPPSIVVNKGLVLEENTVKKITTLQLSATDQDSEPGELTYRLTKQPQLGHIEHVASPGTKVSYFTQADLAARSIQYVHTSDEEKHSDDFIFSVSDGVNEVSQTFYITIRPVDDALPVVQIPGMRVQEGVRKTITEFELKATDADTEAESLTFTIVQQPRHGTIERTTNGHHYRQTNTFTMDDIYQNHISYNHDGSNSLKDRFSFSVSDGTNPFFIVEEAGKEIVTAAPQKFKIDILPVDDGTPRIVTNLGLQWLEYMDNKAINLITKRELLTIDPDTEDKQLIYEITTEPKHGHLENKLRPGIPLKSFTQEDINLGLICYILNEDMIQKTMDTFKFLVKDSKPNIVHDNVFHIQWSLISFEYNSYNVSEKASSVSVTVKRTGNLNQYAIVLCRTEQGSATSTSGAGSKLGQQDYVEYAGQVQFDEREDTKACTIIINDDQVFENLESFNVELSMPAYALLGKITRAKVNINDTEDEPTLQFDKKLYRVNESAGFLFVPVERKGDTSSTVSAICYTVPKTAKGSSLYALESGSDFKSRGMTNENRVVFGPGVSMSTCDVQVIDDSEYEEEEDFEITLADASYNARIGESATAKVVINGPNDASLVFLGNSSFTVSEDAGSIEIPVIRYGSDLSTPTSVWCATHPSDPPSAAPGIDYIPSSKKIDFAPGKTEETCTLTILDDVQNPIIEGNETFIVFLSSAQGAELTKPYQAIVAINDSYQDVPTMEFGKGIYRVKEKENELHVPVIRTGDLSYESSVRCYTQQLTADVLEDFEERRNSDDSRLTFQKGEKVKNCTVLINDDTIFEPEERFQLHLGNPLGNHWSGAKVGKNDVATITISNDEDAPTIEFEEATYQVHEPPGPDGTAILNVKVIRKGDQNRTSKVRCSTRDGSAQSGIDYNPKSRVLKFSPNIDHILFKVEILSNDDREWHESFSLVLGPDDPVEAILGDITMATVTILDQEAAGSLILPAPPIVVSLVDYDHVEEVTKEGTKRNPSPGYPLVCVTPCDTHFPKYSAMKERCDEAGINQSTVRFSWEVATPTDTSGARSPFETVTDTTPFTSINHMVLDSIYFSRRFHVRCVAKAVDKAGHVGTPLRSNIVTIGTDSSICHTPVVAGTARGFQAQSFIATLRYLDVKHKEHPNRIHISVQIPHQDGMLPLVSTMPLHNLHFLLSESIYRHQHICSNLVTLKDLRSITDSGFLDDVNYDSITLGPGYDRPFQFDPNVREPKTIQLYKHLNLKSCIWTFDAYYDMTELIDVCGGSVTADFQVRDSAQSFLTVSVPLYVSYIYVTAPRGWASLEHHTEMEFSFFYDTVLWRTGIQTDSVLSARLQIIRIYIRDDGRLVIEFKTHAKFRGHFVMDHHTLPGQKSQIVAPDHLGGIEFDLQLLWSAQTFDSPYQLWRATSSYNRKDYSGEYTIFLIPCTVQPTQPWIDPGDKPLACTAHAPEKFLIPIAFQQTNRPVPVVYSLNTEFHLCNNEKVFMMDPSKTEMSMAEMDYKGAFSMGQKLYGRVLWNPEQNLNSAYRLQLEKVYLCTGKDGYVPFFDPTGTIYNEGPQYGCIQPNKHLKHRFLLLDRNQPEVTDQYFHDVPFDAQFASDAPEFHAMRDVPGVDGFTMKVDALYKVEAGHQWYLQVIYIIGPESLSGPRVQRSLSYQLSRQRRDLVDKNGKLTLDDSLIYDNENDQVKNGTNMKNLRLESEAMALTSHTEASIGGAVAAVMLLLLFFITACFLARKCKHKKKLPKEIPEEYPLNTKVEICNKALNRLEKNLNGKHCTEKNINILNKNDIIRVKGVKVKQVNLNIKLQNNLQDGTEV